MRQVLFWTFLLICLFKFLPAQAADYSLRFGPSIQQNLTDGSAKVFGLRREDHLLYGVHFAQEIGGFVDNGGAGRKSSGLVKLQLGTTPGPEVGFFGKAFVGPCLLTAKDSQLGGYGQFCTDAGIGVRDEKSFVLVSYMHISSAGLAFPNAGRDWLIFETGLRF